MTRKDTWTAMLLVLTLAAGGCPKKEDGKKPGDDGKRRKLVLYAAGDSMFTKEIVDEFRKSAGVDIEIAPDTEATRGIGLRLKLEKEKDQPRADVYWNNELVNTLILKKKGLLEPYKAPSGADIPDAWRDSQGYWAAFGARARIFLVNTTRVKPEEEPKSIYDLLDPKWNKKAGMARPTGGTAATYAAALFELLGEDKAKAFYTGVRENGIVLCLGNGMVKDQVASGELAWGWTDTNDANVAIRDGKPVKVVYPDQGEGQIGTLLIPHSIALVKGGPNPEVAKEFIHFVLQPNTETLLAAGLSAQIPLRDVVGWPKELEKHFLMDVGRIKSFNGKISWDKVADRLDTTIKALEEILK